MSQNRTESATHDAHLQKLDELRWRIDLLPAEQRPHLHELANVAEEQYRRLQKDRTAIRQIMDDLRLIEKYVRSDAKAAQRRVRTARRRKQSGKTTRSRGS